MVISAYPDTFSEALERVAPTAYTLTLVYAGGCPAGPLTLKHRDAQGFWHLVDHWANGNVRYFKTAERAIDDGLAAIRHGTAPAVGFELRREILPHGATYVP